ncbi:MarR family winged helix-turn-helix transcriptional regulator [Vibrio salinus]|uniref:MarR family winged helix-turn-helix transcriptional regulator n=1 Tax=Vibrio salinus TaxID=2899784 RepID=UPI001E3B6B9A|nr:MarR family transcriptional regulator [Vibrio salinus]MCE0494420.1 MarR family transcriptional regulator [Vibrio salinus]
MDSLDRILNQWAIEKPELDTLPMGILGRLLRLSKHLETEISQTHHQFGLKLGEFDVLATLRRAGNPYALTPSELLSSLLLTSGAMTNRLDKLENKQLITRQHNKEDRRSVSIQLTPQGLQLIDRALVAHVETQHGLLECLNEDKKEYVNEILKDWLREFELPQK